MVSITVMIVLFFDGHWLAASLGIAALAWGDGMGSVVGRRFGRHRLGNGKSLEGTLGVFLGTVAMSSLMIAAYTLLASAGLYSGSVVPAVPFPLVVLAAGATASVAELACPGAYDNLAIPISVSAVMFLMGL